MTKALPLLDERGSAFGYRRTAWLGTSIILETGLLVQTEVPLVSGVFSDQAFVDRLVERIRGRFCYVLAWRLWFEKIEGYWRSENAEARLRDEYRLTVEEVVQDDEISLTSRRKAINSVSQQAALWLLREEEKLRMSPEKIAPWLKRAPSDSLSMRARESWGDDPGLTDLRAMEAAGNIQDRQLFEFVRLAGAHAKEIPNILIRTDHKAPDPGQLFPVAQRLFGERVIRVDWSYWRSLKISPSLALHLSGAHLVFLDGMETGYTRRHFPQETLRLYASLGTYPWHDKESVWHDLTLPSHFVICGPPVELRFLELDIRPHLLMLSSLTKERTG